MWLQQSNKLKKSAIMNALRFMLLDSSGHPHITPTLMRQAMLFRLASFASGLITRLNARLNDYSDLLSDSLTAALTTLLGGSLFKQNSRVCTLALLKSQSVVRRIGGRHRRGDLARGCDFFTGN